MEYINRKIKNNMSDRQKLIHTYISIVKDYNRSNVMSYNEIIRQVKENFNFDIKYNELLQYFEPTIIEEQIDLQIQLNNLGLKYERI